MSVNVFVSYSHADAPLVPELFRANKSLVFQDINSTQSGKRWRSEIAKAVAEPHLVVVFWCDHGSQSYEVSKEWQAAIEQAKDLLPLLLAATPLPPELNEFQWIDFREAVGASHSSIDSFVMKEAADSDTRACEPRSGSDVLVPLFAGVLWLAKLAGVFAAAWL